ncbi:MAG: DUF2306 domain-containing protein [Hyphomonadaceae bacterium]|nr:DUF2306 domain-containing protein [Hyphomonadaceae bacterium]
MTRTPSKPAAARTPLAARPAVRIAGWAAMLAIVFGALTWAGLDPLTLMQRDWRLKAPDFALVARQPPLLLLHLGAALTALAIGLFLMLRPKGVGLHKALGWMWVVAMAVTAASSFFLHGINGDRLSLIHLLSGWTAVMLPMGVVAIRRRDVARHRRVMTGLFMGGLVVAGAFTFLPGRLMWAVFFG